MPRRDIPESSLTRIHLEEPYASPSDHWLQPGKNATHDYRGSGSTSGSSKVMRWSPCNICHKPRDHKWHGPPFRTCSYCGSIHPLDLINLDFPVVSLAEASSSLTDDMIGLVTVEWADWKYGYPHKLYFHPGPGLDGKFYPRHLREFPELILPFNDRFAKCGIEWTFDEKGLGWRRV